MHNTVHTYTYICRKNKGPIFLESKQKVQMEIKLLMVFLACLLSSINNRGNGNLALLFFEIFFLDFGVHFESNVEVGSINF